MIKQVKAYVDGSYKPSITDKAGFGYVIIDANDNILFEYADVTLESALSRQVDGELYAALGAIKWAVDNNFDIITIYYDYAGIEQWAVGNWRAKSTIALMYINKLQPLLSKIKVKWIKVKSHSGNRWNEYVDQLVSNRVELEYEVNAV